MTYNKNDPDTIRLMFDTIAENYDKTNAVLSLGMHQRWNKALVQTVLKPSQPKTFLDLCCGTGAIAFDYLNQTKEPIKAYLLDFSAGMLQCAQNQIKKKPIPQHNIEYLQADAQSIPLINESIDCVTIAYGIRNVKQPSKCIEEMYRVLSKGGTVGILELTQPKNPIMRLGHSLYLRTLLPVLGKLLTTNQEAYQYLNKSIQAFIPPEELKELLKKAGFQNVQSISLCGGIATLFTGQK